VLSCLQFASLCRKSIRTKWSNSTVKASVGKMSPLTIGASLPAEVEKHMDGEMQCFIYLRECKIWYLTTVDCFFLMYALFDGVVDSRETMPLRGSSSSQSFGLMPHVSQIHLNYEVIKNQLRTT
jgi:hypothetical protein